MSTQLFVEPRDLTINISQFDFVLYALNLFFNLLLKMVKQIYIYIYVYVCICMNMPFYPAISTFAVQISYMNKFLLYS
jgi:hypothetical protein